MTTLPGKQTAVKPTQDSVPEEVFPKAPVQNTATPAPMQEEVTPAPMQEEVTPAPMQEEVTPTPMQEVDPLPLDVQPAPDSDVDATISLEKKASPQAVARLKRKQSAIRARVDREKTLQIRRDRHQAKKEEIAINRIERYRSGINSVFLDILDLPGDAVSAILNQLLFPPTPGEGRPDGPIPSGGFREMSRFLGAYADKLPDGFIQSFLGNMGLEAPAEDVFGNVGTQERSEEFEDGRMMGEGLVFSLLSPGLAALKVPKWGPISNITKIKRFFKSTGELAVAHPLQTLTVETIATGTAAVGLRIGKNKYPDSVAAQFIMGMMGGSTATLLPLRTIYGTGKQLGGSFLDAWGSPAALRNAQKQLQKRVGSAEDLEAGLKRLEKGDQGEDAPGFYKLLSPAERTELKAAINFQTAFFRDEETRQLGEFARWRQMHDLLIEIGRTPAVKKDLPVGSVIADELNKINILLESRLSTVMMKLLKQANDLKATMSPKMANIYAKELILEELEIAENSLKILWKRVDMKVDSPTSAATSTFKRLLQEVEREEGRTLFKLGNEDAGGDLHKFLGYWKTIPAVKAIKAKKAVPASGLFGSKQQKAQKAVKGRKAVKAKNVWVKGEWGDQVSLSRQQGLRSRILQIVREERTALAPNMRRISLLNDLAESMLHGMGGAKGAVSKNKDYLTALRATRAVKERFADKPIADILRVNRNGDKVPPSLTLENIFTGAGKGGAAQGQAIFERILKSLEGGSPDAPVELIGAAEQLIKYRVNREVISNGKVDVSAAEEFLKTHATLMDTPALRSIRDDIEELVKSGNIVEFKRLKNVQLTKQVNDPKLSMAAFYVGNGPALSFKKIQNTFDPKMVDAMIVDLLDKVKTNPEAKDGLDGHLFLWMLDQAKVKQTMNLETPEIISGATLESLWNTKNVQKMGKAIFSPERRDMMEKVITSAKKLDVILHAHASKGGTFDLTPNVLIERILRYAALRFSPLPSGGGGSIAAAQLVSENVRDAFRTRFKDPALHILYDAFLNKNEDLLKSLFMNIETPKEARFVATQVNSWFYATNFALGERIINDAEEDQRLSEKNKIDIHTRSDNIPQ